MSDRKYSNIDLLKIVSIFLIISHHFIYDARVLNLVDETNLFYKFLYIGGKLGTAVFVLITGFFLSKKDFEIKRILKLILKTDIYSYIFLIIYFCFFGTKVGLVEIIKCLLPVIGNRYWFVTAYVVLYFLTPYINIVIEQVDRRKFILLLVLILLLESILPMFGMKYASNGVVAFILYYLIGAYIRKFDLKVFKNNIFNFVAFFFFYFAMYVSVIIIYNLSSKVHFLVDKQFYFTQIASFPVIMCATFLFLFFKNISIAKNKFLSVIASSTLGIYLIHDNFFLKKTLFPYCFSFINQSDYYILYSLLFIFLVIIVCSIVDVLFSKIIDLCINSKKEH